MANRSQPLVGRKDSVIDVANAFAGRAAPPGEADLAAALRTAMPVWDKLLAALAEDCGIDCSEWRCYSVKAGWALRLNRGKRTIVWLAPCQGCFRASFVLGAKALQEARESGLAAAAVEALAQGVRYPEGTGVRLLIRSLRDLRAVKQLAAAKIRN